MAGPSSTASALSGFAEDGCGDAKRPPLRVRSLQQASPPPTPDVPQVDCLNHRVRVELLQRPGNCPVPTEGRDPNRPRLSRPTGRLAGGAPSRRHAGHCLERRHPRRPCLTLGAKPTLTLRRVDSGLVVVSTARHMVDAGAVLADIALDAAPPALLLNRRPPSLQALAFAPIPRQYDFAAPHAPPCRPCARFLRNVRSRVPPVGEGPAFLDHPRIEIPPGGAAHRHDPTVAVAITFLACHGPSPDPTRKRTRRLTAARPPPAAGQATLLALRRIDPVQANPNSAYVERIAVDHTRGTRERTASPGNPSRLFVPGLRCLSHSDLSPFQADLEARASASPTSPPTAQLPVGPSPQPIEGTGASRPPPPATSMVEPTRSHPPRLGPR